MSEKENNGMRLKGYDPNTGAPIWESAEPNAEAPRKVIGFDPDTGNPIYEQAEAEPAKAADAAPKAEPVITGYDPMTGKPVYGNAAPKAEPVITGYDPMTGKPIYGSAAPADKAAKQAKAPKGGGKKGKKTLWIILGIVLAVLVIAGVVLGIVLSQPKVVVGRALAKSVSTLDSLNDRMSKLVGVSEYLDDLTEDNFSMSADLKVKEYRSYGPAVAGDSSMAVPELNGAALAFDLSYDPDARMASLDADVTIGGMATLSPSFYTDDVYLYVKVQGLLDEVLRMKTKDVYGQLQDSVLFGSSQYPDTELNLEFFPAEEVDNDLAERFGEHMGPSIARLIEKIEIEKGDKATVDAFGGSTKAKKYAVTIPEEELEDVWEAAIEFIGSDETMRQTLEAPLSASASYTTLDDMLDQLVDAFKQALEEDILIDLFIARGQIVMFETEPTINGDTMLISGVFEGEKNPYSDMTLTLSQNDSDMTVGNTVEFDGKDFERVLTLSLDKEELIRLNVTFDGASKHLDSTATFTSYGSEAKFTVATDVAGSAARVDFNDLELKLVVDNETLSFGGSMSVLPYVPAKAPDGKVLDVFELNQNDSMDLIIKFYDNYEQLMG